jgi:hypothetical protein
MELEAIQVDKQTLVLLPLTMRKKMISLRLNADTVLQYDKLAAYLSIQKNVEISRTHIMEVILEEVLRRPELLTRF